MRFRFTTLGLCWVLAFFTATGWSFGAQATALSFTSRCEIDQPTVAITIDQDPREFITCREHDGKRYLSFSRPIHLLVGNQSYPAKAEWDWIGNTCAELLKSFADYPEMQFEDPQTQTSLLVNLDREYRRIRVAMGYKVGSCVGLRR